jgi:hypothetical protein
MLIVGTPSHSDVEEVGQAHGDAVLAAASSAEVGQGPNVQLPVWRGFRSTRQRAQVVPDI